MLRAFVNCGMVLKKCLKSRRRSHALKGSHSTGGFFQKPAATLPLIKIYRISLISTGSISLDSTFKVSLLTSKIMVELKLSKIMHSGDHVHNVTKYLSTEGFYMVSFSSFINLWTKPYQVHYAYYVILFI
jgi:hypothetical protein